MALSNSGVRIALRLLIVFIVLLSLTSCASFSRPVLQSEVDQLVLSDRLALAADKIEGKKSAYGNGNYLLYYLDRGLVEYYAGRYAQSVESFAEAKQRFAELYTKSVSREMASWIVNDYALPYRGTDYEYVLVNVFQALNYLALGNVSEALVEARDMDAKYQSLESNNQSAKRGRFEDNGFARMFMGFIHEASGRVDDSDEARLFYQQAEGGYKAYYGGKYEPAVLRDRLAAIGRSSQEAGRAVVYVLQLVGFSPLKASDTIMVPVDKDLIVQVAFPKYVKRNYETRRGLVTVEGAGGKQEAYTELGVSIEDLAIKDLASRKAALLSKSIGRPAIKYILERKQRENIEKSYGSTAGAIFSIFSSLYNIVSERADLRSWQTLPAEIRIARFALAPGDYRISVKSLDTAGLTLENVDMGEIKAVVGRTVFLVGRSRR